MSDAASSEFVFEEPPGGPYAAGDLVSDKYRLEAPIGFGGMGTVWRAHNELLDAPVALKLIRRDARWSWSSERLLREARATASLRHPAIVRVFDFGTTTHGDPFIAMELLRGESLRDLLDRDTSLPAVSAVRHLLPILAALGCAHARGIVHRDLKPENIYLAHDDTGSVQPKVVDFGIAKFDGGLSRLTTAGVLLGSPAYMSPEQALGEAGIDQRVDVWSLAVVLYEVIAGHPPWEAPSCPALLRAIVDDDVPSLIGIGGVDATLWAIIEVGLAKKRDDRWASSRDFGRALAGWLSSRSIADDVSGSSLMTHWLEGEAPPPLKSVPLTCSKDTKDRALAVETASRPISPLVRRAKRIAGLVAPVAASIFLLGVGSRSSSAPTAAARPDVVSMQDATPRQVAVPEQAKEMAKGSAITATATQVAPIAQIELPANLRPPPARQPPRRAKPPASSEPIVPKESARSMDFGF
jgi:serine/threonine protein kinase